ncbi:hypothetical protein Vretifemale_5693 [Volvox reticuliferus]|uniref:Uncharacterized protein n=1 Tax=Volvox reticuliferus TaxID=1737510 RepID=A0A8J4FKS9_9CHLO|nr:hypothetical protein Vretifemale_5693 [Volvox reticuliferus]
MLLLLFADSLVLRSEPGYDARPIAMRLAADLQLPQNYLKLIEDEIARSLKGFKNFKDLGGPRLVRLQLYVRRGDTVFRDELEWDVNDPAASTLQYACEVCQHLHLDLGWAQAINSHLHDLVHEVVEVKTGVLSR